jgi:hypothetical protein
MILVLSGSYGTGITVCITGQVDLHEATCEEASFLLLFIQAYCRWSRQRIIAMHITVKQCTVCFFP